VTVIAIDGPAGSGKSTIARALARRLDIPHVDTGAYYRALTLAVLRAHVEPTSEDACLEVLSQTDIARKDDHTLLNGDDVETAIRGGAVDANVSAVSRHPRVRKRMVEWQRDEIGPEGAVVEGRDAATVIVPDATLKVWLTAAPALRAQRRASQKGEGGQDEVVARISGELEARDHADRSYTQRDDDAVEIDTGHGGVADVVERIVALLDRDVRRV
jgi:cytidylate kinase